MEEGIVVLEDLGYVHALGTREAIAATRAINLGLCEDKLIELFLIF